MVNKILETLSRRDFLKYTAWFAADIALTAGVHGETKPHPNFVFILADDLGWADLGCYGSDLHETPNIDKLARQGMRFTDAYAAAPVCSPTRASIMTGKYPARLHTTIWYEASANPPRNRKLIPPVTQGNMPHEQVTIAEIVRLHKANFSMPMIVRELSKKGIKARNGNNWHVTQIRRIILKHGR